MLAVRKLRASRGKYNNSVMFTHGVEKELKNWERHEVSTVEHILRGHCIKGSPVSSSHLLGSFEPKYSASEPVLRVTFFK